MSLIVRNANVQHGEGTDGVTNYSRQITALTGDLMAISERSSPDTGWDASMSSAGLSEAVYMPNQIGGSDGNAIWYKTSKCSILSTYTHQLSVGATSPWDGGTNVDKCAVAAKIQAEGKPFYLVATHLCQNAGANADGSLFSTIREAQMKELLRWTESELLGLDTLIVGDLNLAPNFLLAAGGFQIDYFFRYGYVDMWRYGISKGIATANWGDRNADGTPDMIVDNNTVTHDTRLIDWCLLKTVSGTLSLVATNLPDLRANCLGSLTGNPAFCPDTAADQRWGNSGDYGVRPSDHNWLENTFAISQIATPPVRSTQFSWMPNVGLR